MNIQCAWRRKSAYKTLRSKRIQREAYLRLLNLSSTKLCNKVRGYLAHKSMLTSRKKSLQSVTLNVSFKNINYSEPVVHISTMIPKSDQFSLTKFKINPNENSFEHDTSHSYTIVAIQKIKLKGKSPDGNWATELVLSSILPNAILAISILDKDTKSAELAGQVICYVCNVCNVCN